MAFDLERLLGYVSIMKHAEAVKQGVPNPYPPAFMTLTEDCVADMASYIRLNRNRTVSRLAQYGAPPQRTPNRPIDKQDVKLLHTIEENPMNPVILNQLRSLDSYEYNGGVEFVSKMTEDFIDRFQTLRVAVLGLLLANGRCGFDANGNLLADTSFGSAAEQVTWPMSANNQNQLNGVIAASWDLQNTDIPNQLRQLQMTAAQLTRYPIRHALVGRNVPSYIALNDFIIDYMAREGSLRGDYLNLDSAKGERGVGGPFMRLFGIDWWACWEAFFDNDQTATSPAPVQIWGNDNVTFIPDVSKEWYGMGLGSYPVPKSLNLTTDARTALDNVEIIHGMFGFGYLTYPPNPIGISTVYGDTFLPICKVTNAIFQATVKF